MTNETLAQLHDIASIDKISFWPLAPGWLFVIGLLLLVLAVSIFLYYRQKKYKNSWQYIAKLELLVLKENMEKKNLHDTSIELSQFIRRVAMQIYSRQECASITGLDWLKWLTKNDPRQYDWQQNSTWLINVPYQENIKISKQEINSSIDAIENWIR